MSVKPCIGTDSTVQFVFKMADTKKRIQANNNLFTLCNEAKALFEDPLVGILVLSEEPHCYPDEEKADYKLFKDRPHLGRGAYHADGGYNSDILLERVDSVPTGLGEDFVREICSEKWIFAQERYGTNDKNVLYTICKNFVRR